MAGENHIMTSKELTSYLEFKHEPIDTLSYELFNIDPTNGFRITEAGNARRFHPDKQRDKKKTKS